MCEFTPETALLVCHACMSQTVVPYVDTGQYEAWGASHHLPCCHAVSGTVQHTGTVSEPCHHTTPSGDVRIFHVPCEEPCVMLVHSE